MSADAVVIGAGPNGLTAAIRLSSAGLQVIVREANQTAGGGCRSDELTLPGFTHDTCSAVHPLGVGSPYFRQLPLGEHGLEWIQPPAALAHPLDDGTAVVLERSISETAANLKVDNAMWRRTVGAVATDWDKLISVITGEFARIPRHPVAVARFGALAVLPAATLAKLFRGQRARALLAGCAAHSFLPLTAPFSAAFALSLAASGHAVGWPIPRGGSQQITEALVSYLRSQGGEVVTGARAGSMADLPEARAYLFDVAPRSLAVIAGSRLSDTYQRRLLSYRHGPGVFKVDYALDGPVPWRSSDCGRSATVHVGGTFEDIAQGEAEVAAGRHPERPFVIAAQPSLFDDSRAPVGKHILWAYCHVPNGSDVDMSERIEAQLERFAPGFRERVLARATMDTAEVARRNANFVGGDISCGAHDGLQLLARPMVRANPYATSAPDIFLCSAATPPGGGVHGMCGFHAAETALKRVFAHKV